MPMNLEDKLVVAVSTSAVFDMREEHSVFERSVTEYRKLQLDRLNVAAAPGPAFRMVKKLLAFNGDGEHRVEVVFLSRNDCVSGQRAFESAQHHGLDISRGVFTCGRSPFEYLKPLRAAVFLSVHEQDVRGAISAGFPGALSYQSERQADDLNPNELRIAFDGDGVLFSDEAERVFQSEGLKEFHRSEDAARAIPLQPGPLKVLLHALHRIQKRPPAAIPMRIRTSLVTARNAPAHKRAIQTLMNWGVEVDEAMFLGGLPKHEFLAVFQPDLFFDDQDVHLKDATQVAPGAKVPYGVASGNNLTVTSPAQQPLLSVPAASPPEFEITVSSLDPKPSESSPSGDSEGSMTHQAQS